MTWRQFNEWSSGPCTRIFAPESQGGVGTPLSPGASVGTSALASAGGGPESLSAPASRPALADGDDEEHASELNATSAQAIAPRAADPKPFKPRTTVWSGYASERVAARDFLARRRLGQLLENAVGAFGVEPEPAR